MLAPLLVTSTLTLFASGVALIAFGRDGGLLLDVHTLSFYVFGVLVVVHIVAYLAETLQAGTADWRRDAARVVAGAGSRRALLVGALLAGVIVALANYLLP